MLTLHDPARVLIQAGLYVLARGKYPEMFDPEVASANADLHLADVLAELAAAHT